MLYIFLFENFLVLFDKLFFIRLCLNKVVYVHTNGKWGDDMKILKRILFGIVFFTLTILLAIYTYAFFDKLDLDTARESITIYDKHNEILYETNFKKNMEWTSIDDIPEFIQNAFISVEDKRFYYHAGFDPIRIAKALGSNLIHGGIVEGGSTITQQYAKNLFLTNEQTVSRKIDEFFYAARMEMQYSKEEILEGYLNTIYYGHGIYGINAAAQYFFDKELVDLDVAETAMLIGIPNGPSIYSPFLNYENAKNRQSLILQVLYQNEVIDDAQYAKAKDEELQLAQIDEQKKEIGIDEYYIDAIIQELSSMKNISMDQELHVYTSYDVDAQKALAQASQTYMKSDDELECSGIVVQPFTGNVLAVIGGKDYTQSQYNRATLSQRQVASTIKPLLYYTALTQGFTPSSTFLSQPTKFQIDEKNEYDPHNYNDEYPYREISMINAIAMSDNIYAVKTHLFLGTATLHNALLDFGINQSQENASEALGTVNMSILELSRIYNTFASEGLYYKPSFIQKITDGEHDLYIQSTQAHRLLDRDTTLVMNQALTATYDLKNMIKNYPTMAGNAPKTKVGVKSGTSDWDSWVIGFNPEYTIGFWTGFDDNRDLTKEYYETAKHMFKSTFDALYPNDIGPWYQPSDAIEVRYVDPISGEASASGSPYWYLK